MGDSETVVAQSSAIQEHPSTTVNRDLAASTGIDTMDVDNVIPHEDDRASIQVVSYCCYSNPLCSLEFLGINFLFLLHMVAFLYIFVENHVTHHPKNKMKRN